MAAAAATAHASVELERYADDASDSSVPGTPRALRSAEINVSSGTAVTPDMLHPEKSEPLAGWIGHQHTDDYSSDEDDDSEHEERVWRDIMAGV